jgi:hypothetical protein
LIERKTGKLIWSHDDLVDLLGLKDLFDEAMILLPHTTDVLSPDQEMMDGIGDG